MQCRVVLAYRIWGIDGATRLLLFCDNAYTEYVLKKFGAAIGPASDLHSPLSIHNAQRDYTHLTIGQQCHVGQEVFLDLCDAIILEDCVTISMRVMILTHTDVGKSPLRESNLPPRHLPVVIKRGAYVGAGVIILQGVTIGERSVIGAGAVVVDSIPPHSIAVGVPARVIKSLDDRVGEDGAKSA